MTETVTHRHSGSAPRLAGWIARLQRQLSNRLFAGQDAFARENQWEITTTTGRLGLGARNYRDPRFSQRPRGPGMYQGRADEP